MGITLIKQTKTPTLLLPRWIATAVPGEPLLESQGVLVRDGLICEIAAQDEIRWRYPDAERVELADHLLIPGLVNLHTHAAMALLRGVGDDLPLHTWLQHRI